MIGNSKYTPYRFVKRSLPYSVGLVCMARIAEEEEVLEEGRSGEGAPEAAGIEAGKVRFKRAAETDDSTPHAGSAVAVLGPNPVLLGPPLGGRGQPHSLAWKCKGLQFPFA